MTIETWMDEFYPEEAQKATTSDQAAIQHSLRKWEGALPTNTEKHGVVYREREITDEYDVLRFNSRTCALCERYPDSRSNFDGYECYGSKTQEACPIVRMLGVPCDYDGTVAKDQSYWSASFNNPTLMIELLRRTKEFVENSN